MRLAREGYPFVAASVLIAVVVHFIIGGVAASPFWLVVLFVMQFFRDPRREIPTQENLIVSPADGKVVAVDRATNPITSEENWRVAIFLNVFSVHATRSPCSGEITLKKYQSGKFLNASLDKSSEENERNTVVIQSKDSKQVTCVQIAGLIARRILCYVEAGDKIERGEKYGFIRFGSRVELFLPSNCEINIAVGDKIKGGCDVIGSFK